MRYDHTPTSVATIKRLKTPNGGKMRSNQTFIIHCWQECEIVKPFWRKIKQFLKKLNR